MVEEFYKYCHCDFCEGKDELAMRGNQLCKISSGLWEPEFAPSNTSLVSAGYDRRAGSIETTQSTYFRGAVHVEREVLNKQQKDAEEDKSEKPKHANYRDMINHDALKDAKCEYELKPNTNQKNGKGLWQYICRHNNCNKVFYKTWNLIYHFRTHTNIKPFECSF
mmetsp:Transcript_23973/g.27610  ORF Transcript_23973/g.27610 Transcript_23973/m.27610 type:complete len:165 (+) Transcript_23973:153-647(+)